MDKTVIYAKMRELEVKIRFLRIYYANNVRLNSKATILNYCEKKVTGRSAIRIYAIKIGEIETHHQKMLR